MKSYQRLVDGSLAANHHPVPSCRIAPGCPAGMDCLLAADCFPVVT